MIVRKTLNGTDTGSSIWWMDLGMEGDLTLFAGSPLFAKFSTISRRGHVRSRIPFGVEPARNVCRKVNGWWD